LLGIGAGGTLAAAAASAIVFIYWAIGEVRVLGYTPLMLMIAFFGGLTALGLGIVGQYQWLALQNSRGRPAFVVKSTRSYPAQTPEVRTNP
jgi:hypothetical protein